MKLNLSADKVTIRGPRIDGSYVLSFEFGEYEVATLAKLLAQLKQNEVVNLTIEQGSGNSDDI